jgi:hypothetical protein
VDLKLILWQPTHLLHTLPQDAQQPAQAWWIFLNWVARPDFTHFNQQADWKPFLAAGQLQINFLATHTSPPHHSWMHNFVYKPGFNLFFLDKLEITFSSPLWTGKPFFDS